MIRSSIAQTLQAAIASLQAEGLLPAGLPLAEVQEPKNPEHGDFATSFALQSAKAAGKNPRELADLVCRKIIEWPEIEKAEAAGPGFINLTLSQSWVIRQLEPVLASAGTDPLSESRHYARPPQPKPLGINVEFVSVNPNGPITIGSGRGAAFGSALCNVLAAAGHRVHREYYINDGVNSEQMRLFALSVRSYVLDLPFPEKGYKGDYVQDVAARILKYTSRLKRIAENVITGRAMACDERSQTPRSADIAIASAIVNFGLDDLKSDCVRWAWERLYQVKLRPNLNHLSNNECGTPPSVDEVIQAFCQYAMTGKEQDDNADVRAFSVQAFKRVRKYVDLASLVSGENYTFKVEQPHSMRTEQFSGLWQLCANRIRAERLNLDESDFTIIPIGLWQAGSQEGMIRKQRQDLAYFRTNFKKWFSEYSLHANGLVEKCLDELRVSGLADEESYRTKILRRKDSNTGIVLEESTREIQPRDEDDSEGNMPTLWLRSTLFGDDQDRVLRRKDGRLTYIASDLAYHKDKFNRPKDADKLITILGPDHHGYIGRLRAVIAALLNEGQDHAHALETAKEKLEVVIFQLVRFVKDGQPAPMRKRDGNIYALIDLVREIGTKVRPAAKMKEKLQAGTDVARFFYLMRSHETTFDFDLDLAQRQSDDNPVFYVQYAHARICSVIAKGAEAGLRPVARPELLVEQREKVLALKVLDLPYEISRTSEDYSVHRLATYAVELARTYHHFYDVCRVVKPEEADLSEARLALCEAARIAIASVLQILGVSAPERMERQEAETEE